MKKICSAFVLLLLTSATIAQKALNVISIKETERIERTLSADDMQGRRTFTPGIEKAANFIASEFEKAGLQKWNNGNTYLQSFSMVRTKTISQKILVNGVELDAKKAILVSPSKSLIADNNAGYDLVFITGKMNFPTEARKALGGKKNTMSNNFLIRSNKAQNRFLFFFVGISKSPTVIKRREMGKFGNILAARHAGLKC